MTCNICNHEKRNEIEQACLLRNFGDTEVSLRSIADNFKVDLKDLQVHVLMHIPSNTEENASIATQIKRREADILKSVIEEQFITFKNLSSKVNTIIAAHTQEKPVLTTTLSKSMVELYLGCSQSIRDNAAALMKMDVVINGEKDEGLAALSNLVTALNGN